MKWRSRLKFDGDHGRTRLRSRSGLSGHSSLVGERPLSIQRGSDWSCRTQRMSERRPSTRLEFLPPKLLALTVSPCFDRSRTCSLFSGKLGDLNCSSIGSLPNRSRRHAAPESASQAAIHFSGKRVTMKVNGTAIHNDRHWKQSINLPVRLLPSFARNHSIESSGSHPLPPTDA